MKQNSYQRDMALYGVQQRMKPSTSTDVSWKIWTDFSTNIHQNIGHTSLYFLSVKIAFLKNILVRCLARVVSVVMHKDLTGRQSTCSSIKVVFRIFRLTILVICRSGMKGNLRNLGQMFQAIFLCTSLCFIVLCVKLLQCCLSVVRIPYFSSWLLWGLAAQQTFPKN